MTVLAVAIIPMVGMFEAGLRAASASGGYDAARALANEKLEEVRALPYSKTGGTVGSAVERYAPPGSPEDTEGDLTYSVETAFVDQNLSGPVGSPAGQMRIEVTVEWEGGSFSTTGFVSGEPP